MWSDVVHEINKRLYKNQTHSSKSIKYHRYTETDSPDKHCNQQLVYMFSYFDDSFYGRVGVAGGRRRSGIGIGSGSGTGLSSGESAANQSRLPEDDNWLE